MQHSSYVTRRGEIETYFDRTAAKPWEVLTSNAPVGRIRATVRAGRDRMRQTLLSSSIKLVATTGFAATTTQAVLDDTGVSRGSLLHQFPTRSLMMVATAEEALSRMQIGRAHV